jgi:hypothetical protein
MAVISTVLESVIETRLSSIRHFMFTVISHCFPKIESGYKLPL